MRAAGLVCLGAGAGLIRGDLRDVRGSDVACRSGGVVVTVRGARPRTVPVLARYHARLLAAARFAGTGLICGGADPGRRNITNPLITALDGGTGLPRLDTSRLRATWLADCAELLGLATFMARGRDQLLPAARRPGRRAGAGRRGRGGAAARGRPAAMIPLAAFEEVIDASGVAPRIEAMLPVGVRHRQLSVRTLLAGMCLTQADHRPAHLTRVHQALIGLPEDDQRRLGVIADWKHGPHLLTYRQTERTFGLVAGRARRGRARRAALRPAAAHLRRPARGIRPGAVQGRQHVAGGGLDGPGVLLPAPAARHQRLRRPRGVLGTPQEQPAAQRRRAVLRLLPLGRDHDARGERAGRPRARPPRHAVVVPARPGPRLRSRADRDARPGDPARRHPRRLRLRPPRRRRLGHPAPSRRRASSSRTCTRTTAARRAPTTARSSANGNLYCPQTPRPLLELGPLARTATREQAADHDRKTAELARYKLGRLTSDDQDGYHRVQCPAAMGKIRCPLRPASMTLDRDRPEILQPPEHPQACCAQQTITVPPDVLAKTAQKHDYPSAAWRRSYARRTGAERGFATAKDPASNDISRGWCRLMGLAPLMLFTTTLLIVRNQRILHAWNARQEETQRRAAAGLPPKTRKRRRKTLAGLAAGPP